MSEAPDPETLLALSDERDQWLSRILAAERAAFARGRAAGQREGYERAEADMAAAWRTVAVPVSRGRSLTQLRVDQAVREAVAMDRARSWQWWNEYHNPNRGQLRFPARRSAA